DLTINAAAVSGAKYGVNARNIGSGALTITTSGAVTGTNDDGIYARNAGTDLTINAASVTGGIRGIMPATPAVAYCRSPPAAQSPAARARASLPTPRPAR
ncbi:MAG: hypothetical protein JKY89_09025, partial [Immundisolibacteraceae bacterium]|nr:hypothetical protein [Immundisolibacteraceae bacterium]